MIASVHLADVGAVKGLTMQPRTPKPARVAGLRSARLGFGAPLGPGLMPKPDFRRLALIAFWDDDAALDRFVDSDALAGTFAGGWSVRLEPLRAHGTWPGLDAGLPVGRKTDYDGPVVVITIGRLRISQALRFLRASAKAEAAVLAAPGRIFATGFGSPPIVSTISLWESPDAVAAYAYDVASPAERPRATDLPHTCAAERGEARQPTQ